MIKDETQTISDSEEEVDENNNKMQANSYTYVDLTEEDPGVDEETMKTNSPYDDTKDLLKLLNNETIEKSTKFKPDSELSTYSLINMRQLKILPVLALSCRSKQFYDHIMQELVKTGKFS